MRETPSFISVFFSALLLVPAFFWLGGKLFHVRIDVLPLAAAGIIISLFYFLKRK